ncbi:MAG: NAD-dependent epimerase/dehydratase family protein [Steroidobacterales bacterium]
MPQRVLVTGAGGFIGRWSLAALRARGYEVHAVLAPRRVERPGAEPGGAIVHRADLLDLGSIDALLAEVRPTHLLHFAWIATPGEYWMSAENRRWLDAGTHLAQRFLASGGQRAVMAGSCAEYDWTRASVCREASSPLADTAAVAPSAYAAAKLAMHRSLARLAQQFGASTAWGRIFFQFGPAEHPSRLVPTVIRSLLAGREALCTAGTQVRSFLHVADVGEAFAALLDSQVQGAVNIGSAERLAVAELIGLIAAQIGRVDLVRLGAKPLPAGEPALLVPELSRLHGEVGWQPRFTVESAIADTIAWWRQQP